MTRSRAALLEFLKEHGKIVLKPFDGMGGRSIFVVTAGDLNTNVIIETLTATARDSRSRSATSPRSRRATSACC